MKLLKSMTTAATLLALTLGVTNSAFAKNKKITVGVMNGNEHQVFAAAAKVAKEKYGVDVKFVVFDDYVLPNEALQNKKLDANAFQHLPYLTAQIKSRGYTITPVGNTFLWPIAAYSKKIKNTSELKTGAKISIPNDPSNQGRALLLLQAQGLIKLKSATDLTQSIIDIVENPKKIKITPVDAAIVLRTLNDVDLGIINNNYAADAGLSKSSAVFTESGLNSPYTNFVAARFDNKNDPDILDFVKAVQSDAVFKVAEEKFGVGSVIKGWE